MNTLPFQCVFMILGEHPRSYTSSAENTIPRMTGNIQGREKADKQFNSQTAFDQTKRSDSHRRPHVDTVQFTGKSIFVNKFACSIK